MDIQLETTPPPSLDTQRLQTAMDLFLSRLGHPGRPVSLLLADDAELARLNQEYRGKTGPTDVLSWSYLPPTGEQLPAGEPLGDLAISLQRAQAQAAENGWELMTELLRLLAHGAAHLAGYDHMTAPEEIEMRGLEIELLKAVGLENIYPE